MPEVGPLRLHEEILLLALRDEVGTVASGSMFKYAIGGGILAELMLGKRVTVEPTGRKNNKHLVFLNSATPLSNEVVDECLSKVRFANTRKSPVNWVMRFAQTKNLKERVAARLCEVGILRADRKPVLWVFNRKTFPEIDHSAEAEIISRLDRVIFTDTADVDTRTNLLASLAAGTDMLKHVFDKKKLKARKERIKMVVESEVVGRATKKAVQTVQAALAVASTVTMGVSAGG